MTNQISDFQLFYTILANISKLIYNIYKDYRPLLHLILSALIIYTFYRLGKWRRLTTFEKKIIAINQYQDNIQKVSIVQKKRYQAIKTVRYIFGFLLFLCGLFNFMLYVSTQQINSLIQMLGLSPIRLLTQKIAITGGTILILLIISFLLTKLFNYLLSSDKKLLTNLQQQQQPELNEVIKYIGPKALDKIKHNQCKQEYERLVKIEANAQSCSKCDNKNSQVSLLRDKYNTYTQFIHSVFSFKWCDVCSFKKKTQLYQQNQYPTPQKPFSSEQQEVGYRISELYKRCQKLNSYFKGICQRNCSYNYWKESKVNGKKFIHAKTDINHILQTYHGKN